MGLDWLAGAGSADSSSSGANTQQQLGYGQTEHAHMLTAIRQVSSFLLWFPVPGCIKRSTHMSKVSAGAGLPARSICAVLIFSIMLGHFSSVLTGKFPAYFFRIFVAAPTDLFHQCPNQTSPALVLHFGVLQPLFIQTPLQVMLETLVEKLQLQADAIAGMQGKVSSPNRQ
jgi:hypothetical protein